MNVQQLQDILRAIAPEVSVVCATRPEPALRLETRWRLETRHDDARAPHVELCDSHTSASRLLEQLVAAGHHLVALTSIPALVVA
jgi:hypothetical protein